jgi:hypothetical protein
MNKTTEHIRFILEQSFSPEIGEEIFYQESLLIRQLLKDNESEINIAHQAAARWAWGKIAAVEEYVL